MSYLSYYLSKYFKRLFKIDIPDKHDYFIEFINHLI